MICSLAEAADRENYCKPTVTDDGVIRIEGGRHPVVEKMLETGSFVPNDTLLDMDETGWLSSQDPTWPVIHLYDR